jgi:hypothetical protein
MTTSFNNPRNIQGLHTIIASSDINSDIDLEEVEDRITGSRRKAENKINNAVESYDEEIDLFLKTLGVDVETSVKIDGDKTFSVSIGDSVYEGKSGHKLNHYLKSEVSSRNSDNHKSNPIHDLPDYASEIIKSDHDSINKQPNLKDFQPKIAEDSLFDIPESDNESEHSYSSRKSKKVLDHKDAYKRLTNEQKNRDVVDAFVRNDDNESEYSSDHIDILKENDDKLAIIDEIEDLRVSLTDDDINVSHVPVPTIKMSYYDLCRIKTYLSRKNMKHRGVFTIEELVTSGAKNIENIFDGKTDIFGYRLDATNWSNTVKTKLRRMRPLTGTFIADTYNRYQIGTGTQIMIELIPSLLGHISLQSSRNSAKDQWTNNMTKFG